MEIGKRIMKIKMEIGKRRMEAKNISIFKLFLFPDEYGEERFGSSKGNGDGRELEHQKRSVLHTN